MNLLDYHWDKIGWKTFEDICLYLAECIMPDRRFALYGRVGEQQDGIDILSKNERGESVICIQCKRYEKMTLTELKAIIEKFEENIFNKQATTFVIATRASLNSKATLDHIIKEKGRLKEDCGIHFETWDIHYIEKELTKQYTLTSRYFGVGIADTICVGKNSVPESFPEVQNYISRKVMPYIQGDDSQLSRWILGSRGLIQLPNLFSVDILAAKKICLLADAYQGKTTILKQLAHELFYHSLKLKPVFIEIKRHSHRPLLEILNTSYQWWRSVPIKELVIIVDGLDEVDTGRFQEAIKFINEFSAQFPPISILFSCRKLFFHQNEAQNLLTGFAYYELYPLQKQQIDSYISRCLQGKEKRFLDHIDKYGLEHFLYHPFYLQSLVQLSQQSAPLPKSRVATFEYFIKKSFQEQAHRPLLSGAILKRKENAYRINLQYLAFVMQLKGQNYLDDRDVQYLFPDTEDVELLLVGSILTFSNEKWSFQNAIFQEYLSALILEKLSFDQISKIVSVGTKIKKVKTKWIQTLVGLLSLLEKGDDRKSKIYELLRKDNIELITNSDSELLSPDDRRDILIQLLTRYDELGLRPMVIYEDTIGRYFRGKMEAITLLLQKLKDSKSVHLKRIVWRILQNIDVPASNWPILFKLAEKEIAGTNDATYTADILDTILRYKIGTRQFVEFLIHQEVLSRQLIYRDRVYDTIVQLGLSEDFYDFAIQGIQIMFSTPTGNSMRTERAIEQILLNARSRRSLEKLFDAICSDEWINFQRHKYSVEDSFILKLTQLCAALFKADTWILLSVVHFIKELGHKHLREEFKEIDRFFFLTETANFPIRYFLHLPADNIWWQLGELLTQEAFDFLFAYYEEGYIDDDTFNQLIKSTYYQGNRMVMLQLNKMYVELTGKEDVYQHSLEEEQKRQAYEELKKRNDETVIQSQSDFEVGLRNFFSAYGKASIPEDDIFIDYDEIRSARRQADSSFVTRFIVHNIKNQRPITLSYCLGILSNEEDFHYFQIYELLNYIDPDDMSKKPLRDLLKRLYNQKIQKAEFTNAIRQNRNSMSVSNRELLLTQVFKKMKFPTEVTILIDMLCMDTEGINNFRTPGFYTDKKPSLSEIILDYLTPEQQITTKATILQRLESGIDASDVFENHIALCRKLDIYESAGLILSFMKEKKIRPYDIFTAAEIYLELGGELEQIADVLNGFTDYGEIDYFRLVMKLKDDYPSVVISSLLKAIHRADVSLERRLDYAQLLIELGETQGLLFLLEQMKNNDSLPWGRGDHFKLDRLDTSYVLEQLFPFLPVLLQNSKVEVARKEIKSILVELLFALAVKSEEDLMNVDSYLKAAEVHLQPNYESLSNLNWYRERMFENFRDTGKGHYSLDQAIGIMQKLKFY